MASLLVLGGSNFRDNFSMYQLQPRRFVSDQPQATSSSFFGGFPYTHTHRYTDSVDYNSYVGGGTFEFRPEHGARRPSDYTCLCDPINHSRGTVSSSQHDGCQREMRTHMPDVLQTDKSHHSYMPLQQPCPLETSGTQPGRAAVDRYSGSVKSRCCICHHDLSPLSEMPTSSDEILFLSSEIDDLCLCNGKQEHRLSLQPQVPTCSDEDPFLCSEIDDLCLDSAYSLPTCLDSACSLEHRQLWRPAVSPALSLSSVEGEPFLCSTTPETILEQPAWGRDGIPSPRGNCPECTGCECTVKDEQYAQPCSQQIHLSREIGHEGRLQPRCTSQRIRARSPVCAAETSRLGALMKEGVSAFMADYGHRTGVTLGGNLPSEVSLGNDNERDSGTFSPEPDPPRCSSPVPVLPLNGPQLANQEDRYTAETSSPSPSPSSSSSSCPTSRRLLPHSPSSSLDSRPRRRRRQPPTPPSSSPTSFSSQVTRHKHQSNSNQTRRPGRRSLPVCGLRNSDIHSSASPKTESFSSEDLLPPSSESGGTPSCELLRITTPIQKLSTSEMTLEQAKNILLGKSRHLEIPADREKGKSHQKNRQKGHSHQPRRQEEQSHKPGGLERQSNEAQRLKGQCCQPNRQGQAQEIDRAESLSGETGKQQGQALPPDGQKERSYRPSAVGRQCHETVCLAEQSHEPGKQDTQSHRSGKQEYQSLAPERHAGQFHQIDGRKASLDQPGRLSLIPQRQSRRRRPSPAKNQPPQLQLFDGSSLMQHPSASAATTTKGQAGFNQRLPTACQDLNLYDDDRTFASSHTLVNQSNGAHKGLEQDTQPAAAVQSLHSDSLLHSDHPPSLMSQTSCSKPVERGVCWSLQETTLLRRGCGLGSPAEEEMSDWFTKGEELPSPRRNGDHALVVGFRDLADLDMAAGHVSPLELPAGQAGLDTVSGSASPLDSLAGLADLDMASDRVLPLESPVSLPGQDVVSGCVSPLESEVSSYIQSPEQAETLSSPPRVSTPARPLSQTVSLQYNSTHPLVNSASRGSQSDTGLGSDTDSESETRLYLSTHHPHYCSRLPLPVSTSSSLAVVGTRQDMMHTCERVVADIKSAVQQFKDFHLEFSQREGQCETRQILMTQLRQTVCEAQHTVSDLTARP